MRLRILAAATLALSLGTVAAARAEAPTTILNASYDIGRELSTLTDLSAAGERLEDSMRNAPSRNAPNLNSPSFSSPSL